MISSYCTAMVVTQRDLESCLLYMTLDTREPFPKFGGRLISDLSSYLASRCHRHGSLQFLSLDYDVPSTAESGSCSHHMVATLLSGFTLPQPQCFRIEDLMVDGSHKLTAGV